MSNLKSLKYSRSDMDIWLYFNDRKFDSRCRRHIMSNVGSLMYSQGFIITCLSKNHWAVFTIKHEVIHQYIYFCIQNRDVAAYSTYTLITFLEIHTHYYGCLVNHSKFDIICLRHLESNLGSLKYSQTFHMELAEF